MASYIRNLQQWNIGSNPVQAPIVSVGTSTEEVSFVK
jgi:hypothetical protein